MKLNEFILGAIIAFIAYKEIIQNKTPVKQEPLKQSTKPVQELDNQMPTETVAGYRFGIPCRQCRNMQSVTYSVMPDSVRIARMTI
jgi:hypothetical protein